MWKNVVGYEELYEVNENGEIRSKDTGRIRRTYDNGHGYIVVDLYNGHGKSTRKKLYVHRIVAEAFISNPEHKPEINHLDNNPGNNQVDNLEWCYHIDNINYGDHNKKVSESQKGRSNGRGFRVRCVNTGKVYCSCSKAEEETGVAHTSIRKCCQGKFKYAGRTENGEKMTWEFAA